MREILFRGKRTGSGEWVEGSLHTEYGEATKDGNREIDYRILGMRGECYYVDSETVGQYTGLKDKNGTMIFEGDIVRAKITESTWNDVRKYTEVYVVTYHPKYCYFYLKREGNNLLFDGDWHYFVSIEKVVGNIHDNPELLENGGDSQ